MDERIRKLAGNLVNYSCRVGNGDKVYIHYTGASTAELAGELVKAVYEAAVFRLCTIQIPRCSADS